MSREIKFRAWDTECECWVEDKMNIHEHLYECECSDSRNSKWVLNWIVEQYTGLKDKNGKEIYEGDIIHGCDCPNAIVIWAKAEGAWYIKPIGCPFHQELHVVCRDDMVKVIGNIHENGELLEGKNGEEK